MEQINPNADFPIVRQLEDPADTTTYYVRAVVRNSATGATLDTINLTDQSGQRFTGTYRPGGDVSGLGYYVDIEITVYTDSGYTTKSNNYQVVSRDYLVQQRVTRGSLGGGGVDIDYDKVRRIVQEELKTAPKGQKIDLAGVLSSLGEVKRLVQGIKMPEIKPADFSVVINAIDTAEASIKKSVEDKEIPEPEKVDFGPLLERMDQNTLQQVSLIKEALQDFKDTVGESNKDVVAKVDAALEAMENIEKMDRNITFSIPKNNEDATVRSRLAKLRR